MRVPIPENENEREKWLYDPDRYSAFQHIEDDNLDGLKHLITHSALDPNATLIMSKEKNDHTLLFSAIVYQRAAIFEYLIASGANPRSKKQDKSYLFWATRKNPNASIIRMLVAAGIDVDRVEGGTTAVERLNESGYPDQAALLVELGADPTLKGSAAQKEEASNAAMNYLLSIISP